MGKLHTVLFLVALCALFWPGMGKRNFDKFLSDILNEVEDEIVEELTKPSDGSLNDALQKLASDELAQGLTVESRDASYIPPMVVSGVSTDDGGKFCRFPFTYLGKQYDHCITINHGGAWCATGADYGKDGKWGNCKLSGDVVSSDNGRLCHFPFTYRSKQYSTCITKASSKAWCGTSDNYDTDHKWGYCMKNYVAPALAPPAPLVQPAPQPAVQPAVQPPAIALAWKQVPGSKGCWTKCGKKGGKCDVCGADGWCCRKGRKDCPDEINAAGLDTGHSCVVPAGPAPPKFVSEGTCNHPYSKEECKAWAEKTGHAFAAVGGKSAKNFPAGCYVKYKKGTTKKIVVRAYFNKGVASSPDCGKFKRDCVCKA